NNFKWITEKHWQDLYTFSSFIVGLFWALLIFYIPTDAGPVMISMLYIILAAVMAGAITVLSVVKRAFYAYITPVFLATFAFSIMITTKQTLYLSAASIIYYIFILTAGQLINKRFVQNFSLHIENEDLISELHEQIVQKQIAEKKLIENQQQLEETVDTRTKELSDINETLVDEINERRRIESNLKHMAHHDSLTNLPNRLLLDARLNHAIERAKREDVQVAVMFIDLDHFKTINDSLGHDAGDQLLISVSNRLLHCVREDDTVARLGGDEFIIIIEQVHDIADLDPLLKKIMKLTSQTISINNHDLSISASIGISIYPDDGKNVEQLMRNADAAMYHVKENGRHKYHFYTRDLTAAAYDRVILETDLKRAIADGQILVYYQPQVSLESKKIVSVEALVRWNHPELGILPPKQFLHIAEKTNLINNIGKTVLTIACKQIAQWKKQGLPIETVAVNVAGNQIHHSNLEGTVKNILEKTNCKTEWLELEITEDFIIKKTKQAIATLQKLRDLGISLAIDDFGTGYSSLSYLKQLPVNKLKIDRSFVRDINNDMEDATLVQAIIAMGKSLNLKLIAEGVEDSSHEIFLSAHGCEYAQGFYYSKPVPAEMIEKMLIDKDEARRKNIKLVSK
ncbi:MAG: membrane-associated sensor domain-containing protein, partial [Gammaproteobacteria bacterium]|nr:membrane-associated sensor domain-containing protein [Gammaproteobacteria bacterium]